MDYLSKVEAWTFFYLTRESRVESNVAQTFSATPVYNLSSSIQDRLERAPGLAAQLHLFHRFGAIKIVLVARKTIPLSKDDIKRPRKIRRLPQESSTSILVHKPVFGKDRVAAIMVLSDVKQRPARVTSGLDVNNRDFFNTN